MNSRQFLNRIERRADLPHHEFVRYYGGGYLEIAFIGDNSHLLIGKAKSNYALWCSLAMYGPIIGCLAASIISGNWWLMFGILTAWGSAGIVSYKYAIWVVAAIFIIVFQKHNWNIFYTPSFLLLYFIINYWVNKWCEVYRDSELIRYILLSEQVYDSLLESNTLLVYYREEILKDALK